MRRAPLHIALSAALCLLAACIHTPSAPADLSALLPEQAGLEPHGPLLKADSDADLFKHINGGADFYIRHGFNRAVFQTYQAPGRKKLTLVIYEMSDADAARSVYRALAGSGTADAEVGDESALEEYYLLFRRGRYYISVTGFDPKPETQKHLQEAAKQVDRKIIPLQ